MPAFHAILIVREEGDIIEQTVKHLLSWCDALYIYDTGSTDGTWEIVNGLASREPRIVLFGHEHVLFTDTLRAWIYERARAAGRFRRGDWIARVDADEFYHIPPPEFIRERLGPREGRICTCQCDFLLSRAELKAWQDGLETVADRDRPIEERRRCFRFDEYPEQRFFRYRRGMKWLPERFDPASGGLLARERIPVRHYRARDPLQVQVRCAIREPTAAAVPWAAWHWQIADWRAWVFAEADPTMHHWAPGTELPEHPSRTLTFNPWRRAAEHGFYSAGAVHLRDLLRPRLSPAFRPSPMDPAVRARIAENLALVRERPFLRDLPEQVKAKRERAATEFAAVPSSATGQGS